MRHYNEWTVIKMFLFFYSKPALNVHVHSLHTEIAYFLEDDYLKI